MPLPKKEVEEGEETPQSPSNSTQMGIVAKVLDGQRYLLPQCECMCVLVRGAADPKGPMTYTMLCSVSLEFLGWDLSLNTGF